MSYRFLFFSVVLLVVHGRDWDKIDHKKYCIEGHLDNTPCVTECKIGPNCSDLISGYVELSMHEKQFLLNLHNKLREEIARGDYLEWNFPPATNIYALNYDDECEYMTACWIRQCNFWHDVHYKVDGSKFGQNLHNRWTTGQLGVIDNSWLERGIMNWFNEYKLLKGHPDIHKSFYPVTKTGHFTALIWHETQFMGCAKLTFRRDGREWFYLYCNYYPNGNWLDSPIYKTSPFNCQRSKKYPHLCGEVKDLIAETGDLQLHEDGDYHDPDAENGSTHKIPYEIFVFLNFLIVFW